MIKGLPYEYVSSFPILAADWRWGICYVFVAVAMPIMLKCIYLYLANMICRLYQRVEIFGKCQNEQLKSEKEITVELTSLNIHPPKRCDR